MEEIKIYTQDLVNKAKKYLSKEYHLEAMKLSDFQAINFFLIDQAINKENNLFIESFDKELPALSQFPAVLSVAISLFFKNFCDNITKYKPGDTLQNAKGEKYMYISFNGKVHYIKDKTSVKELTQKQLKKYAIINAQFSDRKAKTKLTAYKKLYHQIFNISDVPYQFKYKSAIIMSKKEFDEEIKSQKYINLDIKKAIPMRWISSKGTESWKHIPIDPMIYCVPDYETLEAFVLNKGIEIETLVVIGKNKYKDDVSTKIRRALQNDEILNCIILGSEGFNDEQSQFLKWKWTFPEYEYLENKPSGKIKSVEIQDKVYQKNINTLMEFLRDLEKENGIDLSNIKRLRRFLYALVLSKHSNSRNLSQLEYVQHLIKKVAVETIQQDFYELDLDDEIALSKVNNLIDNIFTDFNNNKLKYLERCKFINYLIVPDRLIENWKDEFKSNYHEICALKQFKKELPKVKGSKKVLVLSIYNNGLNPNEVLEIAMNSPHRFSFLSYPEEAEVIKNYVAKYENNLIIEYQSKNRKTLTGIDFKMQLNKIVEKKSLEDIMDNFYNREKYTNSSYDYESHKQVNYCINFTEQNDTIVYDGSKTVLLKKNGAWIKTKTYNILPGDTVRIYSNFSKDKLYEIASQEDSNQRFQEIEQMSFLWKKSLSDYFNRKVTRNRYYDKEALLKDLRDNGSHITNSITIAKWLNMNDKERFPHNDKELIAIKNLVNNEQLNQVFIRLLKVKKFYRGIMIKLGRDLSDDVMDYIMTEGRNKGVILSNFENSEIESFIKTAAPIRKIERKTITEDEESN